MKVLYLDESGDHSLIKIDEQFPVFCLAGSIVDIEEFQKNTSPKIDHLKERYFHSKDIILHSREIRKREAPFQALMKRQIRESFFHELDTLIAEIPMTIIAAVILKKQLKDRYRDPANPYTIALTFIIEQFLDFLKEVDDVGYVSIESRDPKADGDVSRAFQIIMNSDKRYRSRLQKIEFITKKQNDNGHQLADLIAYPIARHGLNPEKVNQAFDILRPKFKTRDGKIEGAGMEIFPKKEDGARVLPVPTFPSSSMLL